MEGWGMGWKCLGGDGGYVGDVCMYMHKHTHLHLLPVTH